MDAPDWVCSSCQSSNPPSSECCSKCAKLKSVLLGQPNRMAEDPNNGEGEVDAVRKQQERMMKRIMKKTPNPQPPSPQSGSHMAIVTLSVGDYSVLKYCSTPTHPLLPSQVRLKVLAAGVNNTDINTRIGWYDKSVTTATDKATDETAAESNGYGDKPSPWPLIQGTDCAGVIVELGSDLVLTHKHLLNQRALVASCQAGLGWSGSDFAGGFQELLNVHHSFVHPITAPPTAITATQLGAIPCAYGTAENMLLKVTLRPGDTVVVPGASGGVGGAVVELCGVCRRDMNVIAIVGPGKKAALASRYETYPNVQIHEGRHGSAAWGQVMAIVGKTATVVVDNVGGAGSIDLIGCLKQGGRYVTSGAIAGPIIELDLRTLYLNDITMFGSTTWLPGVMENLVTYINEGTCNPIVSATFELSQIAEAQELFMAKKHVGKIVLRVGEVG